MPPPPEDAIACSEILLRGIKRKYLEWDPAQPEFPRVHYSAFALNPDEVYLSVDRLAVSSVGQSFSRWYEEALEAAMSLHTGRVRDLGLSVESRRQDTPENPAHAGISGLPSPYGPEEDHHRATVLALALREMARFVTYRDESIPVKLRQRQEQSRTA
jgi:hypothetical protein